MYDAATGSPLPQVEVEMTGEVKVAATTTAAGRFTIEGVPAGTYAISYASARHLPVQVRGLEVVAGAVADANTGMSRRDRPVRTSSTPVRAASPAESVAHSPGGHGGDPDEGLEAGSSRVAGVVARVAGVTSWTEAYSAGRFGSQLRRSALESEGAEAGASEASVIGIEPRVDKPSPNPPADDHQGAQQAAWMRPSHHAAAFESAAVACGSRAATGHSSPRCISAPRSGFPRPLPARPARRSTSVEPARTT